MCLKLQQSLLTRFYRSNPLCVDLEAIFTIQNFYHNQKALLQRTVNLLVQSRPFVCLFGCNRFTWLHFLEVVPKLPYKGIELNSESSLQLCSQVSLLKQTKRIYTVL